jgi:hypothetical protein
MMAKVRYWWIDEGDSPSELTAFPYECHKFIVLREETGDAHVIAADGHLEQHADIFRAVAGHMGPPGPVGALAGGGHGGEHFPGRSEAFGMPPEDVVQAIKGGGREDDGPAEVPSWLTALIEAHGVRTMQALLELPQVVPTLSVQVDPASSTVELEHYDQDWDLHEATLPLQPLQLLLTSRK